MPEENTWVEKDLKLRSLTSSGETIPSQKTLVQISGHHRVGTVVALDVWLIAKCKQNFIVTKTMDSISLDKVWLVKDNCK